MTRIIVLALKVLARLFGQDALFEAFKEVAERRTKIKLVKLDEQAELREIRNDIKETKARKRLERKKKEQMKTSDEGIDFIKKHEGCILYAYDDFNPSRPVPHNPEPGAVKGTLTIGFGHTKTVTPGMTITDAEAEQLLRDDMKWAEKAVADLFTLYDWTFVQSRFDALVSWVFNTGAGGLQNRNLIKAIDALDKAEKKVVTVWNKHYKTSKGVELPGLVRRRREESEFFNHEILKT